MRACFSDNADLPITCSIDINEPHNCILATRGIKRNECQYWQPERAVTLAREILGIDVCRGCKDFFACEEHFPKECWGENTEKVSLCETCVQANVSCPVYPQETQTCVEYRRKDL